MLETKRLADNGWKVVEGSRDAENYARVALLADVGQSRQERGTLLEPSGGCSRNHRETEKRERGGKV